MNSDNTWHSVERDIPYVCITLPGLCSGGVRSVSVSALAFNVDNMRHPVIRFRTNVMAWSLPSSSGMRGGRWNCTKKKQASTVLLQSFNVSAKETSMNYDTETLSIISLGNLLFSSLKRGDRGSAVVKFLCYKSEGHLFDPSWCQWIFH